MRPAHRHGFMLIVVVVVMCLAAGVLAILTTWTMQRYREVQAERVRQVMRAVSDSAVAYARLHLGEWDRRLPAGTITLDVASLAPPGFSAAATVEIVSEGGRRLCRVASHVERGMLAGADMVDLPMTAPATSSASASAAQ